METYLVIKEIRWNRRLICSFYLEGKKLTKYIWFKNFIESCGLEYGKWESIFTNNYLNFSNDPLNTATFFIWELGQDGISVRNERDSSGNMEYILYNGSMQFITNTDFIGNSFIKSR